MAIFYLDSENQNQVLDPRVKSYFQRCECCIPETISVAVMGFCQEILADTCLDQDKVCCMRWKYNGKGI